MNHKKAYIWGLISKFAPSLISLVANMILARLLTPDDFGTVGVLTIIIVVANVLVDSGLGGSLVKEKEISEIDCSTIGCFNFGFSILIYLILFFIAPYIEKYFDIWNLSLIIRLLSLSFVIVAIGLVSKSLLIRNLRFDILCILSIAGIFVSAVVAIIMAVFNCGIYSLVAFQLVNPIVVTIGSIIISRYSVSFKFSVVSFRRLIPFGFFTTITSIIDSIYENILASLVGKYLGVSQAGYFTQAKKLEESLSISVSSTLANVSFPIMTKLKDNLPNFKQEADTLIKLIMKLVFPIMLFVILFSEFIISIVFGNEWLPAASYLSLLMCAGMMLIIETLLRSFIKSLCAVKDLMYITIIKRLIGIILIVLVIVANAEWAIYAYILSCLIGLTFNIFTYTKNAHASSGKFIVDLIKSMITPVVYFIIAITTRSLISSTTIQLVINILLLIIYYFVFLLYYKKSIH